nr:dNTP triphosphohydrolase [uncultured Hyphomonas sp.]
MPHLMKAEPWSQFVNGAVFVGESRGNLWFTNMRMEWANLLTLDRLGDPKYTAKKFRPPYTQDLERILFSPSFRRLANKTQVHPLYDNDHIHNRLIHSLEVTAVGRSLGLEIGEWLSEDRAEITEDLVPTVAGLVQTACMAHDIGNPPFGHSGEQAIGSWFKAQFMSPKGIMKEITSNQRLEFEAFEGNAQGFRMLTRTEMYTDEGGFRLTHGSLAAFTKYPTSAFVKPHVGNEGRIDHKLYVGLKKFGLFENDVKSFEDIASTVGLPRSDTRDSQGRFVGSWWRRHPLSFLMEAADDICYNIMDLEDAFLAQDLEYQTVIDLLEPIRSKSNKQYTRTSETSTISRYRAQSISGAISACADAFKANYNEIMDGEFSSSLIEASRISSEFQTIKDTAKSRIFTSARKTELEVYGRNVLHKVLNGLLPLMNEAYDLNWEIEKLSSYHKQLVRTLQYPIDTASTPYDALHSLTDFVSGMTDRYAVKVAKMLG